MLCNKNVTLSMDKEQALNSLPIEILALVILKYSACEHTKDRLRQLCQASQVCKEWREAVIDHVIPSLYRSNTAFWDTLKYTNWLLVCQAPRVRQLILNEETVRYVTNEVLGGLASLESLHIEIGLLWHRLGRTGFDPLTKLQRIVCVRPH